MFSLIVWYLKQCYVNYFVTAISSIHNLSRTNYIMYFIHKKRIILYIYCCFTKLFLQFCKVLSHCQCLLLILYLCLSAGDGISFVFFTLHGHKFHNWFPHMDLNLYIDEDGLPQLSHWLQYWLVNDTNLFVQAVNKLVRDCCKIGCTLKSDSSMYYIFLSLIMD